MGAEDVVSLRLVRDGGGLLTVRGPRNHFGLVPAGRSVLDVVREVVPEVLYSCEEGYCGSCEQRVLAGTPDHRDSVLSERERAEGRTMMICVSRSKSPRLVLDV